MLVTNTPVTRICFSDLMCKPLKKESVSTCFTMKSFSPRTLSSSQGAELLQEYQRPHEGALSISSCEFFLSLTTGSLE